MDGLSVPLPGRGYAPGMHKDASEAVRTEPSAPLRSAADGGIRRGMRHLFMESGLIEPGKLV